MKSTQLDKLYDKLPLQERAAMGFEAAIRHDDIELDAILKSVPRIDFTGLHPNYKNRLLGLDFFVLDYATQYWRHHAQAFMLAYLGRYKLAEDYLLLLASMEAALKIVCEQTKLDMALIKKYAECPGSNQEAGEPINDELVSAYVNRFTKHITIAEKN